MHMCMDSIFLLEEGARATFLQHILHSFACTYICLWSYLPLPSNCLIYMDGLYNEESNRPSSSSGSLARRLFDEYRQSVFIVGNDRIPGLAFKNGVPYMELKEFDLQRLRSVDAQLQFYQEARIKTAIFMGCKTGEIELGFSNDTQANLETEMRNWFPQDFSGQPPPIEPPYPTDQNRPSSSSSSLRSLSMDSPEPLPFLFTIPSTSSILDPPKESPVEQALRPTFSTSINPLHQATQAFIQIPNTHFPTLETKDEALMTKAISQNASAFKRYRSALTSSTLSITGGVGKQNMQKRAITFFRSLGLMRIQGQVQGSRPTSTQLHHMISERKRREKLNESFQTLRSLLPPGTKKDKASVLASTTEYLASLKAQVEELTQRGKVLEAKALFSTKEEATKVEIVSSNERLGVLVTHEAESTSEALVLGLQVVVRGECNVSDLVIRLLEFLKQMKNVSLMKVEAETKVVDSNSINGVRLRLMIEGGEWDESAFQEAVRRVVADLAQ